MRDEILVNDNRTVHIPQLLSELREKSEVRPCGKAGYEVRVPKQLLLDAYAVINSLTKSVDMLNAELADEKIGQKNI